MRKFTWLISGVALGFVAAHFVNQTTEGRRFFDRLGQASREFSDAFVNGYRDGETGSSFDGSSVNSDDELDRELARLQNKISD